MQKRREKAFKIRFLSLTLLLSAGLNICLIAYIIYGVFSERPPVPYYEKKPANKPEEYPLLGNQRTISQVIEKMRRLSYEKLLEELNNDEAVEDGYTSKDLAISTLVAFHYFDIFRALQAAPIREKPRLLKYSLKKNDEEIQVKIFPGLNSQQFMLIQDFIKNEQWPFTSQGIFLKLKNSENFNQTTLIQTALLTPEFQATELLFSRADQPPPKQEILQLLAESDWKIVSQFTAQQRLLQDLSPMRRQKFLLDCIESSSKTAAFLLIKTDPQYAQKKLEDKYVVLILKLLDRKTPESEEFALAMLKSPRSQTICQQAAYRLYEYAGKPIPKIWNYNETLIELVPQKVLVEKVEKTVNRDSPKNYQVTAARLPPQQKSSLQKNKETLYIVQEGDSLWKISRKYKISVAAIKNKNQLPNDFLKPGLVLRIPISTN